MIRLRKLICAAYPDTPLPSEVPDVLISGLECDSRKVEKGFLFVMIRGEKSDGRLFAAQAMRRGAAVLVGDRREQVSPEDPFILVPDGRLAMAKLASVFYGYPDKKLQAVGITGTNGKTTSSYLIEHFLQSQGKKTGVIGTVNVRFAGKVIPAAETTPGPLRIQQLLSEMTAAGCAYAVMEVSSHALSQHRVSEIDFKAALFTNLTQDHLDYHKTMEAYFECKSRLFLGLSGKNVSALNADDASGRRLAQMTKSRVITYGVTHEAALRARNIEFDMNGTYFDLEFEGKRIQIISPLIGLHNVYNALGALAVMRGLGFDLEQPAASLSRFPGVPGRLEVVNAGQNFHVFIDFAHTPDGLENVLSSLRPYKKNKLLVVFGCGGERDKGKRPQMGLAASRYADFVIVTSDNPRSEDPGTIAGEIVSGFPGDFKKFAVVLDRQKAIRQALLTSREGDIVLLAGKGHETCQWIGNQANPFSDQAEAERVLSGH